MSDGTGKARAEHAQRHAQGVCKGPRSHTCSPTTRPWRVRGGPVRPSSGVPQGSTPPDSDVRQAHDAGAPTRDTRLARSE